MATRNSTGASYQYPNAPTVVQPSDVLNLHPGPSGERGVVKWTAPAAGTYTVSGRFQGIDTGGTTSDVSITKNGATLFSGQVNGYGASVPFSLSVTVSAGDAIEFTVGVGSNGTYNNDSTGLAATIVQQVGSADVEWLVADQLGTPRMVVDKTGSLSGVKRHDYLPFGEEIQVGTGGRTSQQGYSQVDSVRQKFTAYEHDAETNLEFAHARYYSSSCGRFTSPDTFSGSMELTDPQTLNRYSYVSNNPVNSTDPSGMVGIGSTSIHNFDI